MTEGRAARKSSPSRDGWSRSQSLESFILREVYIMKKIDFKFFLMAVGVFMTLISCQETSKAFNPETEKQLVEKTIRNSIGWAKTKDIRLLYSIIANDTNYVEVDPDDRIVKGFDDFIKAEKFWMSPNFKAIRYDVRDLKITFAKSGQVAWFFCILDDINEWKGQPASWENTRWTGVLEKRDGKWIIVQMHFSFAGK
jgi:ketosteroid isomerase-like protein